MITRIQLEAWTHRVVDAAVNRRPVEDSRVELKSEWLDPVRSARQLAGHANSAREDHVLWLIGVDEKAAAIPGATENELSDWLSQLKACFDGLAPRLLLNLAVPRGDQTIVALLFDASRFPYVVKNPRGGDIQREVPIREGNSTQSARREDLIRMLRPDQSCPSAELLDAVASVQVSSGRPEDRFLSVRLTMYIEPASVEPVVFPYHRLRCNWKTDAEGSWRALGFRNFVLDQAGSHAEVSPSELVVLAPTRVELRAVTKKGGLLQDPLGSISILLELPPARSSEVVKIAARLAPSEERSGHWRLRIEPELGE